MSDPLTPSTEGDRTCAHCGYINLADNCPGCGEPYWSEPPAPAEGLRIVPDGTREFVAFAVEYLRSVIPDHATVQAGDRLLAALAQSAAPAKERCLCGGPWPCPDIDAPNYRPEAYVPHGLVQPAAPADGLRAWCVCGRGVLPENWANHLKRKGTHAPLPLSPAPAEGLDVAERRRLAGALANWALSPGESFRTLLPYLDLDYETAYREGWMAFTNAINERLTQAEAAPAEGLDLERLARAIDAVADSDDPYVIETVSYAAAIAREYDRAKALLEHWPSDHWHQPAAPAEGLEGARVRLIGKIALILDGDGGWERQSRAAIVRSIDEVFEPIIRDAERADR